MIEQIFSAVGTLAKPVFQQRGNTTQPTTTPNGATSTGGTPAPFVPTLAGGTTNTAPAVSTMTLASATGAISWYMWLLIAAVVVVGGYWLWKKK